MKRTKLLKSCPGFSAINQSNNIDFSDLEDAYKKETKQLIKYRHPKTGATWSGLGRYPRWVIKWLEDGGSINDIKTKR